MPAIDPLTWLFVLVVVLAAALTCIAVRGALSLVTRSGALVLAALIMLVSYGGLAELMSRPKPATLEWARSNAQSAKVTASYFRENEAIYLWLVFDGETQPRAYQLPWSMEMARQLREAQRDASRRQSDVRMKKPFGKNRLESEEIFHAPARPAPPPKSGQAS